MKPIFALIAILFLLPGCGQSPSPEKTPPHQHEHNEVKEQHPEGVVELTPAQEKELKVTTEPVVAASQRRSGLRPGRVEADPNRKVVLSVQVSGTLREFYVEQGDKVTSGGLVALVDSPEVTELQSAFHEAEVEATLAAKELANTQAMIRVGDDIQRPIESARLEVAKARAERDAAGARLKSAVFKNERLETLLKEGIASRQQVDESRAERTALEAALHQSETSLQIANSHLERETRVAASELRSKAETFPAEARLARARERMRHSRERLSQLGANPTGHDGVVSLHSPLTGVVVERSLSRGETVAPGQKIATVVDTSSVWVWVELQPEDLNQVKIGDRVELSLAEGSQLQVEGVLNYLAPQLSESSQTVRARVVVEAPPPELRLGNFVNAHLVGESGETLPAIASTSVVTVEGQTVVYLLRDGHYRRVAVDLGSAVGNDRVVARGLQVGDRVVVSGVNALKAIDLSDTIGGHSH